MSPIWRQMWPKRIINIQRPSDPDASGVKPCCSSRTRTIGRTNTRLVRAPYGLVQVQVPFTLAFIEEKPVNARVGLLPSCIVMRKSSESKSTIKYEEPAASRILLSDDFLITMQEGSNPKIGRAHV